MYFTFLPYRYSVGSVTFWYTVCCVNGSVAGNDGVAGTVVRAQMRSSVCDFVLISASCRSCFFVVTCCCTNVPAML